MSTSTVGIKRTAAGVEKQRGLGERLASSLLVTRILPFADNQQRVTEKELLSRSTGAICRPKPPAATTNPFVVSFVNGTKSE